MATLLNLATMPVLMEQSYKWFCTQYTHRGSNSDCWHLRHHKQEILPQLIKKLANKTMTFSPRQQTRLPQETHSLYCSEDSLVLKMMSIALSAHLNANPLFSKNCVHLKHHGGLKAAVRQTQSACKDYRFVFKSDILGFYEHINHECLLDDVYELTQDLHFTKEVRCSIKVPSTCGGLYYEHQQGLPRSSPLSTVLAAVALHRLDRAMAALKGVFYKRFMDDWVVLCRTRYQLKNIIRITHAVLTQLKLELHPDKTYIGKIENTFQFLGYQFTPKRLYLAQATQEKSISKLTQLFEQGANKKRLCDYWRRFTRWAHAAVVLDMMLIHPDKLLTINLRQPEPLFSLLFPITTNPGITYTP